jgi:DNA repair protein RecN (Recombination protein N)
LVELHGQQDDRGLLDPRVHRAMLDFGGLGPLRPPSPPAWAELATTRKALETAEARLEEMRREEEFLRHAAAEIAALAPRPGEEAELDARRRLMQAAEKIGEDGTAAAGLSPEGAEGQAGRCAPLARRAWRTGPRARSTGPLALWSGPWWSWARRSRGRRLRRGAGLQSRRAGGGGERLFALRGLARKHGIASTIWNASPNGDRGRVAALDGGAEEIADLRAAHGDAVAAWRGGGRPAEPCAGARRRAARRGDGGRAGAAEAGARRVLHRSLRPADPGPTGRYAVTFTVATNPGAPAGPLNKIASGGELSRFLLALKVCLTRDDSGLTMIFDEIDRGVGGATADAVGRGWPRSPKGGRCSW